MCLRLIHGLVKHARQVEDLATDTFLQWFVTEQIQEEAEVYAIVQQLKLAGAERTALPPLDSELAAPQPPAAMVPGRAAAP